jgi:hypothetical protein
MPWMKKNKKESNGKKIQVGIARFEKDVGPQKGIERRIHPRFLLNLPAEYSRLDSSTRYPSHTLNVSEGGLMICLHEKLDAGNYLNLKIFCSSGPSMLTIETMAQVIWSDAAMGEDGNYRHGVEFVNIAPEDLKNFKGFLDRLAPLSTT